MLFSGLLVTIILQLMQTLISMKDTGPIKHCFACGVIGFVFQYPGGFSFLILIRAFIHNLPLFVLQLPE